MEKKLYDKDIRDPLCFFLEEEVGKVRFFDEVPIGRSRADMLMVTEHELVGIEIKSDADTYARLKRQVRDYDRYFDRNYIVVGTTHAGHVFEHVPDEWGIITVEPVGGAVDLYILRRAQGNKKVKLERKLSLLWRRELDNIRKDHIKFKYKEKNKAEIRKLIIEKMPEDEIQRLLCEELFERDYTLL